MNRSLSVVLVNYNGKKYNDKCIASVLSSSQADDIQIVIVDNASTDGSLELLREKWGGHEQVCLIGLTKNGGFAKGNNAGIRWSMEQGIPYILLLNNDTEVAPDAIQQMLECQKRTGSIVVPKIYYADKPDVIWCAGGEFTPFLKKAVPRGEGRQDQGQFDKGGPCTFANGCCMLLSKEIIEQLGLLDERFFLYYEDNEYSLRAAEKQVSIYYCSKAVVYHKVNGATKGNKNPANAYYITRNWLLCNEMYLSKNRLLFYVYMVLNRLVWGGIWMIQGKPQMVKAMLKGIGDFRKKKFGEYQA